MKNAIAAATHAAAPRHLTLPQPSLAQGKLPPRAAQIDNEYKMTNERTHVDKSQAQAAYSGSRRRSLGKSPRESRGRRPRRGPFEGRRPTQNDCLRRSRWHPHVLCYCILVRRLGTHQSSVVLLLGACNILADAMAMGVGEYLSTKSSDEYARRERAREDWELRNHPEGEVEEMVEIYVQRGMSREDAQVVISTMAKYHDFFVDVMMVEELGLFVPEEDAWVESAKDGLLMFAAFVVFGTAPLVGYLLTPMFIRDPSEQPTCSWRRVV